MSGTSLNLFGIAYLTDVEIEIAIWAISLSNSIEVLEASEACAETPGGVGVGVEGYSTPVAGRKGESREVDALYCRALKWFKSLWH